MYEIRDYKDAENEAKRWIAEKYPRNNTLKFKRVWKEGDYWLVEGEIWVRKGLMGWEKRHLKLKVTSDTGEIIGYSEE